MNRSASISPLEERDVERVASIDSSINQDQLREELKRPWSRCWIARSVEVPVAYVITWHVADELHILNIATREDKRRRGFGRALMEQAIAYAHAEKLRRVMLEVRRSNAPAIALYRSFGFFAMGIRRRYYADDEDAIEMMLLFDAATGDIVPHKDEVHLESC